jgi:class 3 adenylate cyclase/pimeloyl-ACP methyl ester carboxylesterase
VEIPKTRYVRSGELAIAYQVHGSGAHDLLLTGGASSNVETAWHLPEAADFFERLGKFARVIRFDRRDTGVSDSFKDDLTLEAHAADALAVMDATGADRPFLVGASDGARSLAVLAATQPGRVAGLIAVWGTVRGSAASSPASAEAIVRSFADLTWPGALVDLWAPGVAADPIGRDRLERFIRTSSTPRQAERLLRLSLTTDVSEVLPLIQAPTLVLHTPQSRVIPASAVREFADAIPGATYRELSGDMFGIPSLLDVDEFATTIEEFVTGTKPTPVTNRVLATVLFTDLVGSTERAASLGDHAWASLLERHHAMTRAAISAHGGEPVKTLGDGMLATFTGPAQAVRCADRVIAETEGLGLEVRTGVHTGELELLHGDVAGLAVHLAARIMGMAEGGEVLVSRTVRDLVIGSELRFSDRGEHELKGIPDRWAVYALDRASRRAAVE